MHILNMVGAGGSGYGGGQIITGTKQLAAGILTVNNLPFKPLIAIAWPNSGGYPIGQFSEAYVDVSKPTGYNGRHQAGGSGGTVTWNDISSLCTFSNGTFTMRVANSSSTATARYYLAG